MNNILHSCNDCSLIRVESQLIKNGAIFYDYCGLEITKKMIKGLKQQDYCQLNSKLTLELHIYDILKRQFDGPYYPKFDVLKSNFNNK